MAYDAGLRKGYKYTDLIIYLCLIAIDAFCILSRWLNSFNPKIKLLPGFLLSHITDLAL